MQKTNRFIATLPALLLILSVAACEGFLDKEPQNQISREEALDDLQSIQLALNGMYASLVESATFSQDVYLYAELLAGMAGPVPNPGAPFILYEPVYRFQAQPQNDPFVLRNYEELYFVIHQANEILAEAPALPDASRKEIDEIMGEAYFMRAYCHWLLLQMYAQPYAFTPNATHPGIVLMEDAFQLDDRLQRATAAESYNFVVEDLLRAINLLEGVPADLNYATQGAARALLARNYLYMGRWTDAAALATQVINGDYELVETDDWLNLWDPQDQSFRPEIIFWLDARTSVQQDIEDLAGYPSDDPIVIAGDSLINLYAEGDIRGPGEGLRQPEGESYFLTVKFPFREGEPQFKRPVLRLAEMYLVRAEAYARINRPDLARADLNTVRTRANPGTEQVNLEGEALLEEIWREKFRELAYEGHAFFDLRRLGRDVVRPGCTGGSCNVPYPSNFFVLPLPQQEIETAGLEQNDGY